MPAFQVNDMSCNHCVGAITKAVKALDPDATVTADLGRHVVEVETGKADAETLRGAIAEAGYTPELLPAGG